MKTTEKDMCFLYQYMDKRSVSYTVDKNPAPDKISLIKKAIERKNLLISKGIEQYKNSTDLAVNF